MRKLFGAYCSGGVFGHGILLGQIVQKRQVVERVSTDETDPAGEVPRAEAINPAKPAPPASTPTAVTSVDVIYIGSSDLTSEDERLKRKVPSKRDYEQFQGHEDPQRHMGKLLWTSKAACWN
ncbi:hypothetical protein TruAng_003874 [Truncatella angustata]|nr:hypothetical protein TruAng_003874 [Truncatella angustata]